MIGKRLVNTGTTLAPFDPLRNFETVTYTGNGSTQKITGYIRKGAAFRSTTSKIQVAGLQNADNKFDNGISISVWVRINNISADNHPIVRTKSTSTKSGISFGVNTSGNVSFQVANTSNQGGTASSATAITEGEWVHLVGTRVGGATTDGIKVYINGTEAGSADTTITIASIGTFTEIFTIGNRPLSSFDDFNGQIDQVRIFDKALDSGEVTTLYNEDYDSSTKSTTDIFGDGSGVALYELDEDANDTGVPIDSGQSAVFDGSSSYISLSNTAFHYTTLSISAWIKVDSFSSTNQIIQNYESGGTPQNSGFLFRVKTSGVVSFVGYNALGNGTVDSTTNLSTGVWYNVAVTITPSSWKMYVNGNDVSTNANPTTIAYNSTTPCSIGRSDYTGGSGGYFDGQIDNLRVYNDALTGTEVGYISDNDDANIPTGNLQAYYKFDGDATDETTNYDGTWGGTEAYSDPALLTQYNGTPTNINFLGMAFQPNLVWIKKRAGGNTRNHHLFDAVRGAGYRLRVNQNYDESYATDELTSFDSNGFTVGSSDAVNGSTSSPTYVAWCWKAGGAAVSNTDGTITSQVSANTEAGFSVCSYTGLGSDQSFGHGLSAAPEMVIIKRLDNTSEWNVHLKTLGNNKYLNLNTTAVLNNSTIRIQSTGSTVVNVGGSSNVNGNGGTYVSYCFHSVDGYQRVGTYEGNGVVNTIYTDSNGDNTGTGAFQPRWVMIKNADGSGNWMIYDAIRDTDGTLSKFLEANTSDFEADASTAYIVPNSTGWTTGSSNSVHLNELNDTYIYLAIA